MTLIQANNITVGLVTKYYTNQSLNPSVQAKIIHCNGVYYGNLYVVLGISRIDREWNTATADIKDDNTDQTSNARIVAAKSSKQSVIRGARESSTCAPILACWCTSALQTFV
jgi:hypothetical protein